MSNQIITFNNHSESNLSKIKSSTIEKRINTNIKLLMKIYESKLVYSIKETANILNLSYDFIRFHIKSGKISAIYFGDRPMIHIEEVARLLCFGIR